MLNDLRIIDMTSRLGAFAGRMLSQMGAQVIKVESPQGDPLREYPHAFAAWNFGKRSVTTTTDSAEFAELISSADIVLRNPGLSHKQLLGYQPNLIDVVLAPFLPGSTDDCSAESDFTLQARSGLMTIVGDPDRAPLALPGEQAYALGAIQAVIGALTALYAKDSLQEGQLVEVSAYQATVLANYREPLTWGWAGKIGNRTGNLLVRGKSGVRQVWECQDGFVTWALVDNPAMMNAMVKFMGEDAGVLRDVDWQNTLVADMPRETLVQWESIVEAFFGRHSRQVLGEASAQFGLGLSWIDSPADVLASDHLQARNIWTDIDNVKYPAALWVSDKPVKQASAQVPALGEGNEELLGGNHG